VLRHLEVRISLHHLPLLRLYNVASLGLEPSIFVKPGQLHVTLFMLKLLSPDEVRRVQSLMKSISIKVHDAVGTPTPSLTVKGLEIMNDDSSEVCNTVIYLCVFN
jgi:hypothetical protein